MFGKIASLPRFLGKIPIPKQVVRSLDRATPGPSEFCVPKASIRVHFSVFKMRFLALKRRIEPGLKTCAGIPQMWHQALKWIIRMGYPGSYGVRIKEWEIYCFGGYISDGLAPL
jgi:hypothetical protein